MSDPGTTVFNGRYELHRRLGRGGMAEVFLARDQLLDRPVAVKVLFPEFATDPAFVERFRREATAAANLNHPNIVGVLRLGRGRRAPTSSSWSTSTGAPCPTSSGPRVRCTPIGPPTWAPTSPPPSASPIATASCTAT